MMKRRIFLLALVLTLTVSSVYAARLSQRQAALAEKLVRLHVVAASDSEHDQTVKLRVRDAVLQCVASLTERCTTTEQARTQIAGHLAEISRAANDCLRACGETATACVRLCEEAFDTRDYETFSLPAGRYTALRVEIGAATGHNWWCVVYPMLCLPATSDDFAEAAQAGGFSQDETAWMTEDTPRYRVRFKALEYLQRLLRIFQ